MRRWMSLSIGFILISLLSGCLYPNSQRLENRIPIEKNIDTVQQAVDEYLKEEGVLPIKTKENQTPIFEKYVIDFSKLMKYLLRIPGNAFEEGGTHLYVIVNPEDQPTVKLIDLVASQLVGEVQNRSSIYWAKQGKLPLGEPIRKPYYTIDFDLLRMEKAAVTSPVTGKLLPLIIDSSTGLVGIDYSIDLSLIIQNSGETDWDSNKDLRILIAANSYFVPVHSFPYEWDHGEPKLTKR
jgi:hypothetical protein